MQENRYTESDEHKGEQHGRQRPAIKTPHERSREECDGCEGNENRTSAHPALRLGPRDPCVRSLHRVTAGGDTDPPGLSETPARQKDSGGSAPTPSPFWQDAMPRSVESQYVLSCSEVRPPSAGWRFESSPVHQSSRFVLSFRDPDIN